MTYRFAGILIVVALGWVRAAAAQTPSTISWAANARAYRSSAGRDVMLVCPPRGTPGKVWGNEVYTDDSSVCTAAVHAGAITFEAGGTIVLQMKPGQGSYNSTERNGVRSDPWEEWEASFVVSKYVPPPPPPVKPPPPPPDDCLVAHCPGAGSQWKALHVHL